MIPEQLANLLGRYKRLGVLVDANLLLLFVLGQYDPTQIETYKRTRKYTREDFHLVAHLLEYFDVVATTPHILTEVSNLAGYLPDRVKGTYFDTFALHITPLAEEYVTSAALVQGPNFRGLGLADAAIIEAARTYLVFTDDFPLANTLQWLGRDVLNFNHIRMLTW